VANKHLLFVCNYTTPHLSKSWKQGLASTLLRLTLSLSRNITTSSISFSPGEAVEEKSTAPRRGRVQPRSEVVNTAGGDWLVRLLWC